jgi:FXSXX-COOH protein
MGEATRSCQAREAGTMVPDLHDRPLASVLSSEDSALANSVRRVVAEMRRPAEAYAAHSSSTA